MYNLFMLLLVVVWCAALGYSVLKLGLWSWMLGAALTVNVLTFFAYLQDKYYAAHRRWRTQESTLQMWSVLGGWPAAWAAQQLMRHKSSKAAFLGAYRVAVFINCSALALYVWYRTSAVDLF